MNQLQDLRVIELASVLAGPSVGQFFAELGAEVIKVENLKSGGDVTRTWKLSGEQTDDRSAYFCSVNWGKKSIAIDLSTKEGRQIVYDLAKDADIVIASYKPGDAEKLKADYQTLRQLNPQLIYGQITGYGSANPRVGYDAIIQAEAGFMSMNGEPGGRSLKMPVALIDVLAGHHLKEGLLLAMLEKMKTGEGKLVEVSLIQAAVSSLVNQATNWLVAKRLPAKQGSAHPNIAPYGDVFLTCDKKELLLAVGTDRQFIDLCKILGIDVGQVERFTTNNLRVDFRSELNDILSNLISKHHASPLLAELNAFKIPAGLIQSVEDVFRMPDIESILLKSQQFEGVKTYVGNATSADFSHFQPPPSLGGDTDEILQKRLHYSLETIKSLRGSGVIN
ncbi:MAG TPA: CaiB/BaiF CoA-transferase family protein [Chryseosolibacter sp.]|nr:CaiB/BaiF CoA-transferase family protein [Chryseosolibacter sp.]